MSTEHHEKTVICASCDIACPLIARVEGGRVTKLSPVETPLFKDSICIKGIYAPRAMSHPDRLRYPLKRVGSRGEGKWARVSWDEAMDEIAERLAGVVQRYGPEAFVVSTSPWNTSVDSGAGRRFMNLLGSPNWVSGLALCMGNTAAINRMVYGWFPQPDYPMTKCIALFGHNPKRHSWTPIYSMIRRAQRRGAKLIVCDPRRSENAELADIWLPLRAGTDAAMTFGWLKVILDEGLYDHDFVARHTLGFDAFRARVNEFPLSRVVEITGVPEALIRKAARTYATSGPAIIPWTPVTDQQRNSTSAIRLQCALRAICGHLDVPGGEVFQGIHPGILLEGDLERHDLLPQAQKDKQLGTDHHPAFTYRGTAALREPTKRVWGREYVNLVAGSFMAVPTDVFRAMDEGVPYPVKAFFTLGNNTLLSFANMSRIDRAIRNQDLVVAHEHVMTPTAQLADFVLPGDSWLERPHLHDTYGWTSMLGVSEKAMEAPGECRSVYAFWHDLAHRMGFAAHFPWGTLEELYDHRLAGTGMTFAEFSAKHHMDLPDVRFRKYEETGFATPSGKVELHSSILLDLGFDPLPYYRPDPLTTDEFPLRLFTGVREDEYFQTGQRHVPELLKRNPEPLIFLHRDDAATYGLVEGDYVRVSTTAGAVVMKLAIRSGMPVGLVRVPHGWWYPNEPNGTGHKSSAWLISDAVLCPDDEDFLDREQGIPHLKGIPCRVERASAPIWGQA